MTLSGTKVEGYEKLDADLDKIVIGQIEKIEKRGMSTEGMDQYLDTFKYGMPPHGGLGIGLERLTMQLLGEENVREACLFPRDMTRLEP